MEIGDDDLSQLTGLSLNDEKKMSPPKRRKGAYQSGGSLGTEGSSASTSSGVTANSGSNDNSSSSSAAALLQAAEAILGSGMKSKPETTSTHKSKHNKEVERSYTVRTKSWTTLLLCQAARVSLSASLASTLPNPALSSSQSLAITPTSQWTSRSRAPAHL